MENESSCKENSTKKISFKSILNACLTFLKKGGWIFIFIFLLDLITKLSMNAYFGGIGTKKIKDDITLIPGVLELTLIYNTGMSYGILDGAGTGGRVTLAIVSFVAGVIIFILMWKYRNKLNALKYYSIFLILAGDWGNFIDRAFYWNENGINGVIDWIRIGNNSWPKIFTYVCNIADISLTIGVILLIISFIIDGIKELVNDKKKKQKFKENLNQKKENNSIQNNESENNNIEVIEIPNDELNSMKESLNGDNNNGGEKNNNK